jgi:hypothetical protein
MTRSKAEPQGIAVEDIDYDLLQAVITLYARCTGAEPALSQEALRAQICDIAVKIRGTRVWELPLAFPGHPRARLIVRPAVGGHDFAAFGIDVHCDDRLLGSHDTVGILQEFQDGIRKLLARSSGQPGTGN